MKLKHPNVLVTVAGLGLSTLLLLVAFGIATSVMEYGRLDRRDTIQRELNGNAAMIFATCRALRRRDVFEESRLKTAASIEMRYQRMTKPFSPLVKRYFHDRRVAILKSENIQREQFVDFDCLKGMQRAYDEGYKNAANEAGHPVIPPSLVRALKTP